MKRQATLTAGSSKRVCKSPVRDAKDIEIEKLKSENARFKVESQAEIARLRAESAYWQGSALTHNNSGATPAGFYEPFKNLPNEVFLRVL
jgi:hypothetical protein